MPSKVGFLFLLLFLNINTIDVLEQMIFLLLQEATLLEDVD